MNMMPDSSVATHISLLHASMVAHIQDPFSKFRSVMALTCRLLQSSPTVAPWAEYRTRYHEFMMTGAPGWDERRF